MRGAPFGLEQPNGVPTKGTLPSVESTSRDYFSLAGFEVAIIGRFWVATEGLVHPDDREALYSTGDSPLLAKAVAR